MINDNTFEITYRDDLIMLQDLSIYLFGSYLKFNDISKNIIDPKISSDLK